MANFKQVNYDDHTIWLDVDKVMYFYQPNDNDEPNETVVKLITGEIITLDENYEELLADWDIIGTKMPQNGDFLFFICNAPPQAGQGCGPTAQIPEREGFLQRRS